jgi:hypothetical protein
LWIVSRTATPLGEAWVDINAGIALQASDGKISLRFWW